MDEQEIWPIQDCEDVNESSKEDEYSLYCSKYLRKDYTIHQRIMLIMIVQYFGNIETMLQTIVYTDKIQRVMKLKKIPHKSTISRELKRIPERWLCVVLREIVKITRNTEKICCGFYWYSNFLPFILLYTTEQEK